MTKIFITLLTLSLPLFAFSQTDKNGNPIFNSVELEEFIYEDWVTIK